MTTSELSAAAASEALPASPRETLPNLTRMPDIDRVDFGLHRVHVREWLGYVWLCLAEEPASFEGTVIADVTARLGSPDAIVGYQVADLADRRIVRCDWLYLPGVVASGADIDRSVELFHRVDEQDVDACERCQVAMGSRSYARGGVLVPSEHHVGEFHDWVRERVG